MDLLKKNARLGRLILALLFVLAGKTLAQLSPGDLSRPHAFLEGIQNCNSCHGFERKLFPDKCLSCHTFLGERIRAAQGLHAGPGHGECGVCHVEHQGRDFELVYWKGGREKFDHRLTGYTLEGKHSALECRACHTEKNISSKEQLLADKADLSRTYLGLGRQCLSCHADEHRGQLRPDCLSCHAMSGWKPASGFKHTGFALTGKHGAVPCQKCHLPILDEASKKSYVQFKGLKYGKCLDCHKDVHENRFGQGCEDCHNTSGWASVNQVKFDHSRTRFPLQGKHATVACDRCHLPGKPLKGLAFESCAACHADFHRGQFVQRERRGACEECHSVEGFERAKFSIEDHQKTGYPLVGSHLAVPCIACHEKQISGAQEVESIRFKFENTRCRACHKDPHMGAADTYLAGGGCEYCHVVESWRASSFNHSRAKFSLEGKHKDIACRACHGKDKSDSAALMFTGLPNDCQGCHADVHLGQFARVSAVKDGGSGSTACVRCHTPESWTNVKFDHNRDSAFRLDGAHAKIACAKCHKTMISSDGKNFVKFKPLGSACSDCHGDREMEKGKL